MSATYGFEAARRRLRDASTLIVSNTARASRKNAQVLRDEIKLTIRRGRPEWDPLSPLTIQRKGSSKPLIDYADMRGSIDFADVGSMRLFIGIPRRSKHRKGQKLHNIGLIHEYGAPEANIPARPFITPTFNEQLPDIAKRWRLAARAGLKGERYVARK